MRILHTPRKTGKSMLALKQMPKTILSVDFDGTLHKSDRYPFIGEPNKPLIDFLKEHRNEFYLILNTCRHDKQLEYAKEWLKEQGLGFDRYNENAPWLIAEYGDCRKISADIYIDSQAMTPELFLERMGYAKEAGVDGSNAR